MEEVRWGKWETQDRDGHCQEGCLCHFDIKTKTLFSYSKIKVLGKHKIFKNHLDHHLIVQKPS